MMDENAIHNNNNLGGLDQIKDHKHLLKKTKTEEIYKDLEKWGENSMFADGRKREEEEERRGREKGEKEEEKEEGIQAK